MTPTLPRGAPGSPIHAGGALARGRYGEGRADDLLAELNRRSVFVDCGTNGMCLPRGWLLRYLPLHA